MTILAIGPPMAHLALASSHPVAANVFDNAKSTVTGYVIPIVAGVAGVAIVIWAIGGKHQKAKSTTIWTIIGIAIAVGATIWATVVNDAVKTTTGQNMVFPMLLMPSQGARIKQGYITAKGRCGRTVRWITQSRRRT